MGGPSGQNLKLIMTTTLDPAAKEEPQKTVESEVVNQNIADLPLIATHREKKDGYRRLLSNATRMVDICATNR